MARFRLVASDMHSERFVSLFLGVVRALHARKALVDFLLCIHRVGVVVSVGDFIHAQLTTPFVGVGALFASHWRFSRPRVNQFD